MGSLSAIQMAGNHMILNQKKIQTPDLGNRRSSDGWPPQWQDDLSQCALGRAPPSEGQAKGSAIAGDMLLSC